MHWINRSSRSSLIALVICLIVFGFGCKKSVPPITPVPSDQIDDQDEIRRFYPMFVGDYRQYVVTGGDVFGYETVDVIERTAGPEATVAVTSDGGTDYEYVRWSGSNMMSSLSADHTSEYKELDGPFFSGAKWRKADESDDNSIFFIDCEIISLSHPTITEAGSFDALVVQEITHRQFDSPSVNVDTTYVYYTQDVGIIRWDLGSILIDLQIFTPGEGESE
jgi:hypothetical protein